MPNLEATVDLLHLFGDPTRVRLAALLAARELSVAELVTVTQLPQSRVSTHLGKLREAEVVRDRRAGASTYYAWNEGMPAEVRKVWQLVHEQVDDQVLASDRRRCEAVVRAREGHGWPEAFAGEMERHYSPGRTWEAVARAFVGLVRLGDVLDVGAGDGTIAELLASRARSWTCVDRSEKLVAAAEQRLARHENVKAVVADAHALPFRDAAFDTALLLHVLPCAEHPPKVVAEAARVLRKGGTAVVVTLDAHDHEGVTAAYHHLHPGFRPASVRKMLERAGLSVDFCDVTSRERRAPHFAVVTAFAHT